MIKEYSIKFRNEITSILGYFPDNWFKINWNLIKDFVINQQSEIYELSASGCSCQSKQEYLLDHGAAKLLATLRVTQENKGRNTPGVDKKTSRNIKDRIEFADSLIINGSSDPIRRIFVPKPGKSEKRPLGIPTIRDRAKQALAKISLEPEWEARFEFHSYGFRPQRAPRDAIAQIMSYIIRSPRFILDADIRKCFDRINHEKLIQKIGTFPLLSNQIYVWLKAGIMDTLNEEFLEINPQGTPQGGIISPLLCNIALHGMHEVCYETYRQHLNKARLIKAEIQTVGLIRFADDFVVIHPSEKVLIKMKVQLSIFLKDIGLEFNEEKTKIVHTLNEHNGHKPGVTFLGFRMWQNYTKKHYVKRSLSQEITFKFNITPDPDKIKRHLSKIKFIIKVNRGRSQIELIKALNPVIKGWSNYYRNHIQSTQAYSYCDHNTFQFIWNWAIKKHRNKNKTWIADKYFKTINKRKWRFCSMYLGIPWYILELHVQDITGYRKIKGSFSPYSKESVNKKMYRFQSGLKASLYKSQNGKCSVCGQNFYSEDPVEVHHLLPKNEPDRDRRKWMRLVHLTCHDDVHRQMQSYMGEEPDDS